MIKFLTYIKFVTKYKCLKNLVHLKGKIKERLTLKNTVSTNSE